MVVYSSSYMRHVFDDNKIYSWRHSSIESRVPSETLTVVRHEKQWVENNTHTHTHTLTYTHTFRMVNTGPAGQVLHLWVIYIMFGWLLKCCRVHGWLSEQFCVSWCEEADEAAVNSNISLRDLSSSTIHVLKNLRWTHLSAGSEMDRFDIFRALRRNMKDIFVKILTPVETF